MIDRAVPTTAENRPVWNAAVALHAALTAVAGLAVTIIWAATGAGRYWPAWAWFGLGVPLAAHAVVFATVRRHPHRRIGLLVHAEATAFLALVLLVIWALAGGGSLWILWPVTVLGTVLAAHALVILIWERFVPNPRERELTERAAELGRERERVETELQELDAERARRAEAVAELAERERALQVRQEALVDGERRLDELRGEVRERGEALAQREREVAALAERNTAAATALREGRAEYDRAVASLEQARVDLASRTAAVEEKERALRTLEAALEPDRAAHEERRRELAQLEAERTHAEERRRVEQEELERLGRELEERNRELELVAAAASEAERRQRDAERRVADIDRRAREVEAVRARQEEEARRLAREAKTLEGRRLSLANLRGELEARVGAFGLATARVPEEQPVGAWTVDELRELVSGRGREFPERLPEWDAYIDALAPQADLTGRLPANLDELIASVFEPLL
jgi:hypothetical protein